MNEQHKSTFTWLDAVWLVFILALVFLPPIREYHKQLILFLIGASQVFEGRLLAASRLYGRHSSVLIKIILASLLIDHTGADAAINSTYWPIYFLPVVTAAIYFGPLGTLLWTGAASTAYCLFLIPASWAFDINAQGYY